MLERERTVNYSNEFLGKNINSIARVHCEESNVQIPKVIFMLATFLLQNDRLKIEKIFRLNGSAATLEKIRIHLTFGNYAILEELDKGKPIHHEVATLLKEILNELTFPVIPYLVYDEKVFPSADFMVDEATTKEDKIKFFIDLLVNYVGFVDMESMSKTVNVDTLLYLATLFKIVGENVETTTISMASIALLTTQTIFKPRKV